MDDDEVGVEDDVGVEEVDVVGLALLVVATETVRPTVVLTGT